MNNNELKTTSEIKKEIYNCKKSMSELEAKLKLLKNDIYKSGKIVENMKEISEIISGLEQELMKREAKNFIFKDNYSKELEIKLSYMLNLLNSKHFTKGNHNILLLLESLGFSSDEITCFVKSKWSKPVIDEFIKRDELINKNRERSLYLKKKYKKATNED